MLTGYHFCYVTARILFSAYRKFRVVPLEEILCKFIDCFVFCRPLVLFQLGDLLYFCSREGVHELLFLFVFTVKCFLAKICWLGSSAVRYKIYIFGRCTSLSVPCRNDICRTFFLLVLLHFFVLVVTGLSGVLSFLFSVRS